MRAMNRYALGLYGTFCENQPYEFTDKMRDGSTPAQSFTMGAQGDISTQNGTLVSHLSMAKRAIIAVCLLTSAAVW